MKLRNKKTGEIREARIMGGHLQLWVEALNDWIDYDDLDYLAHYWERYEGPKEYWAIDCFNPDGELISQFGKCSERITENRKQIGNYFETKEEAEKAAERLRAWKRLKDKGFKIESWTIDVSDNYYKSGQIQLNLNNVRNRGWDEFTQITEVKSDLDLLFGGEE